PHTVEDPGWEEKMWSAKPVPIYSQQRYMFLSDGECGMALLNRGLPEYEVYKTEEGDTVALTLFRGVGCLGRRDLSHRPGRPSGMSVPTPDAQCLGKRVAEYALVFFRGDWTRAGIPAQALEFNAPPLAVQNMIKVEALELVTAFLQVRNFTGHIRERLDEVPPRDRALLRLSGRELMISAVKKAEDEEALVVRLYNPGDRPVQGESIVLSGAPVKRATVINFNEEIVGPELVPVAGGAYALPEVPPHSALTLSFQFSPGEGEN
ncbi:MAG: glycosyl hydrolase-related protein, partial [Dethiobacteria bacterium]